MKKWIIEIDKDLFYQNKKYLNGRMFYRENKDIVILKCNNEKIYTFVKSL